jgi:hypothetical protein
VLFAFNLEPIQLIPHMKTNFSPSQSSPTQKQPRENHEAPTNAALIQKRAYEKFLRRGQIPGHELEDWLEAENEVRLLQQERVKE